MIIVGVEHGRGQRRSAICVATRERRETVSSDDIHFLVRTLERLEHGTTYPQLADRIASIEHAVLKREPGTSPAIYVNATGSGEPMIDLINDRIQGYVRPVYFTHGDRRSEPWPQVDLGKAFLVSRLQLLLETGRIHLPHTPEAEILAKELLDYEVEVVKDANERYGAFSVGASDDLVTALGLAVQTDRPHPGHQSGGLWDPIAW